jgi:hypothetical protein
MMRLCTDPRTEDEVLDEIVDSVEIVYCPQCGSIAPEGRLHQVLDEDPSVGYSAVERFCDNCVAKVPEKFRL